MYKYLLLVVAAVLISTACSEPLAPFDEDVINQVKDDTSPEISVKSPEPGGAYGSTVIVEGVVNDTGASAAGGLKSVRFEVLNTGISGDAELGDGNSFLFSFSSRSDGVKLSGSISIKITAVDWNGNTGTYILNLTDEAGAFNFFEVETGNGSAVVKWTAVPLSESYTIAYTNDGTIPSASNGNSVAVPASIEPDAEGVFSYAIAGLENGDLYRFRLIADCSDGERNFSSTGSAIPLSPYYLCPSVRTAYRRVELSWLPMEGASSYRVYRSTERDGSYLDVSGLVSQTSYVDKNLTPGGKYFYKIAPSMEGAVMSAAAYASPNGMTDLPKIIGSASAAGSLSELAAEGDYIYAVDESAGLAVYYAGGNELPVKRSTHKESGYFYKESKICVHNGYVYISASDVDDTEVPNHLLIYSLSSPSSPVLVGNLVFSAPSVEYIHNFSADGNILYTVNSTGISSGYVYINTIDISSPDSVDMATDFQMSASNTGIRLFHCNFDDMVVSEGYIYISDNKYRYNLLIFDAADPTGAGLQDSVSSVSDLDQGNLSIGIHDGKTYAWTIYGYTDGPVVNKLREWDVSDPSDIIVSRDSRQFSHSLDSSERDPSLSAVGNSYAWVADSYGRLQMHALYAEPDISSGAGAPVLFEITESSAFPVSWKPEDIKLHEGRLYIAAGTSGLVAVDIAAHSEIDDSVDSFDIEEANDMVIYGNYAYLADGTDGIKIADIADPSNISWIAGPDPVADNSANGITDLKVHGSFLYAACDDDEGTGVFIYDIEDPVAPEEVAETLLTAGKIDLQSNYLYAVSDGELQVINIEDPANPEPVSVIAVADAVDVQVRGDYAFIVYAGAVETGLTVVDVSNPVLPVVHGSCSAGNYWSSTNPDVPLVLSGDYAYLASVFDGTLGGISGYYPGLYVIDISDPQNLAGSCLVEDGDGNSGEGFTFNVDGTLFRGMDGDGRYLYLLDKNNALHVIDCINPLSPVKISETGDIDGYTFVELDGIDIYAGCSGGVVKSLRIGE